ncbi:MAG TPA: DUF1491 family protein [Sphingomicrobium sp.]|nr:DUF1491 family protein [Sphingomicrobium sp.]
MADERLPASVEAAGLIRRAQGSGDFAAVVHKGDPDRGSILLVVSSRGRHVACLERVLTLDGGYRWQQVGPSESAGSGEIRDFLAKRTRFDADLWAIELDIAEPERFIAETTSRG